jgi:hypothetical protein
MIYYGPQTTIEYERSLFEPEGDEIMVMQQHCGGENVIVYKGALKPNGNFKNLFIYFLNKFFFFFKKKHLNLNLDDIQIIHLH